MAARRRVSSRDSVHARMTRRTASSISFSVFVAPTLKRSEGPRAPWVNPSPEASAIVRWNRSNRPSRPSKPLRQGPRPSAMSGRRGRESPRCWSGGAAGLRRHERRSQADRPVAFARNDHEAIRDAGRILPVPCATVPGRSPCRRPGRPIRSPDGSPPADVLRRVVAPATRRRAPRGPRSPTALRTCGRRRSWRQLPARGSLPAAFQRPRPRRCAVELRHGHRRRPAP